MAVGAGSIRRAAKANTDAAKSVEFKAVEAEKPVSGEKVAEEKAVVAEKKATQAKKAPARKTTAAKKAAATKKAASDKQTSPVAKNTVVKPQEASANQVCHITEELPIYLL